MGAKQRKGLFEALTETGVCHAIGVNIQVMKLKTIHEVSKQWFVLISQSDKRKVSGFKNSEGRQDTAERNLSKSEVETFRKMQNNYTKVLHCADGRIYEQKTKSLSQKIDNE